MVRMLYCTGKKKCVNRVIQFFQAQEQSGNLKILATNVETKAKLLRQIDVLRLLFQVNGANVNIDEDIKNGLDYVTYTTKGTVYIKMSSFKVEDNWLKWNIKEATFDFQAQGGQLEIGEETESLTETRKMRICHYILKGPLNIAMICRDHLIGSKLGDPNTIEYHLPSSSQLDTPKT